MKNFFNLKARFALPPPLDDDNREDDWNDEASFENRQKMFSEINAHFLSLRQSSFEKSDELIITISSAFLGLSVGFIKDIVPLERSIYMPLLVASWFFFFGAILTNFVSHFWARNAIEDQIDCARYYYLEGRTKYLDPDINKWTLLTERLNTGAAFCFGLGVLLTLLFVFPNVLREQTYQYNKANEPTKTKPAANGAVARSAHTAPHPTNAPSRP